MFSLLMHRKLIAIATFCIQTMTVIPLSLFYLEKQVMALAVNPNTPLDILQVQEILKIYVDSGKCPNIDLLKESLENLPSDSKKTDILKEYANTLDDLTLFHHAARHDDSEVIKVLLSAFKSESRLPTLKEHGTTPLHVAAEHNNVNSVKEILSHLYKKEDHSQLQELQYQTLWTDVRVKRCLLELCSELNQRVLLINVQNHDGQTALHKANSEHVVEAILQYLTPEQRVTAISVQDLKGSTALHNAAEIGNPEIVRSLLSCLTAGQKFDANKIKNKNGKTALDIACERNKYYTALAILRNLSPEHKHKLIVAEDGRSTAIALAKENHHQEIVDMLAEYKNLNSTPTTDQHRNLLLSTHEENYIIPRNQRNSKMYALLLSSKFKRPGAEREATYLQHGLSAGGFELAGVTFDWTGRSGLEHVIGCVDSIISGCSLLFVCLMSHGGRSFLEPSRGQTIPVNDILLELDQKLPSTVPLIVLIQACQDNTLLAGEFTDTIPTPVSDPLQNQHVTLRRRHTILMLAAARGGKAVRNKFTTAIADELKEADGIKDVCQMFNSAAEKIATDPKCMQVKQCPELRQTTTKRLVLPAIVPGRGVLID